MGKIIVGLDYNRGRFNRWFVLMIFLDGTRYLIKTNLRSYKKAAKIRSKFAEIFDIGDDDDGYTRA